MYNYLLTLIACGINLSPKWTKGLHLKGFFPACSFYLMEANVIVLLFAFTSTLMAHFHRRVPFGPSTPQPSSEGVVCRGSVAARISTADSTLMVGWGFK